MKELEIFGHTVLFTGFGLAIFALCYWLIIKLTPFSIRKEIEEDHNMALAILIASVIIGIAMIISSAVHGDTVAISSG